MGKRRRCGIESEIGVRNAPGFMSWRPWGGRGLLLPSLPDRTIHYFWGLSLAQECWHTEPIAPTNLGFACLRPAPLHWKLFISLEKTLSQLPMALLKKAFLLPSQVVVLICCCITNYPQTQWHKTSTYYAHGFCGSGYGTARWLFSATLCLGS